MRDSNNVDPVSRITGSRRYSFNLDGSLSLFLRCTSNNGRHDFVTGSRVTGPNAFVYGEAIQTHSDIGPHHRWAMGTLFDNISGGEINIQDRGNFGSVMAGQGHNKCCGIPRGRYKPPFNHRRALLTGVLAIPAHVMKVGTQDLQVNGFRTMKKYCQRACL